MGKKPHPPRNAGNGKKTANAVPDSDHIVFTNDKDKSRKQTNRQSGGPVKPGASKDGSDQQQQQPPRPDARKIIGGESWTGKLPQTLLSEHCQKQKWMKPDFSMRRVPGGGYQSAVTLSSKNAKTGEVTTLPPFLLPPDKRVLSTEPSALEARHFAATWTLFRISSMKNMHMMLPPKYRDLWRGEFAKIKQDDIKAGLDWMYAADPFVAKQERDAAKAEAEKRRLALAKENEKAAKENNLLFAPNQSGSSQGRGSKAWQNALLAEMGNDLRKSVEKIVRKSAIWNPYNDRLPREEHMGAVKGLVELGFRQSHIEEALEQCKDQEEALEWLLIYVPEDDLPRWAFPEGYSAGITFASGNLAKESSIRRLAAAGYSADECEDAYRESNSNEDLAAAILQRELCHDTALDHTFQNIAETGRQWQEELETLESIFGDRFASDSPTSVTVLLSLPNNTDKSIQVKFTKPPGPYPDVLPTLSLLSKDVPAYIRLSATRKSLDWAKESLLGEPMMFGIVDWLETGLPDIMESPGRLRDIALSSSTSQSVGLKSKTRDRDEGFRKKRTKLTKLDDNVVYESWKAKQITPQQQKMLHARQGLPAWNVREAVITEVKTHQVTIISGETGSGKSTQSVQFILDDMIKDLKGAGANILCTQPRRISALGLADRVSAERCTSVGDEIGYIIRGDSKITAATKITFMTTGVLLRRLQSFDMSGSLQDISHIVVDEVHERSLDTDFLLALLRDALQDNPHLRVVLMSATLDAKAFIDYFGGSREVGLINIAGRTYPVQDYYLDDVVHLTNFQNKQSNNIDDDEAQIPLERSMNELSIGKTIQNMGFGINYNLIAATVRYIDQSLGDKDGAILIFLPGTLEIDRSLNAVSAIPNIYALPLHASLMPSEQKLVFLPAPGRKRKVIAATNVAETSITIEDVVAVIDTGRVKETVYDSENRVVRLEEVWASQAACKQRRGRAGRVRQGDCYKLFTRRIEEQMAPRPLPEIRRVPLEQLCLSVKATDEKRDVTAFLRQTLTPPEEGAVGIALQLLHQIGALEDGHLTALGRYLALIPADLRCAKLLVYGSIFGCLEPCLTIASILSVKSPFVSPRDKREEAQAARNAFSDGTGDLLLDLKAYNEWSEISKTRPRREVQTWCSTNFLSSQTLRDITSTRSDLLSSLKDACLIPPQYRTSFTTSSNLTPYHNTLNKNSPSTTLLRALIAGSLSPQIARIDFPSKKFAASITGAVELDPEARTIKYFDHPPLLPSTTTADPSNHNDAKTPPTPTPQLSPTYTPRLFPHPSTPYFHHPTYPSTTTFVSYFSKLHTSKLFIRDLTPFNLYTLLLFCAPPSSSSSSGIHLHPTSPGPNIHVGPHGWIKIKGWARIGVLVKGLKRCLDRVLERRVETGWSAALAPAPGDSDSDGNDHEDEKMNNKEEEEEEDKMIIDLVRKCVEFNGMDR
ncbi:putative dead deah box [Phaeomoniella chlamydospora]|uniref:RNA helicase n=1 Tax=Phaeomoniella chlamydospora TaxID=158046 RepID=A0A0G2DXH1_PHACM|nr:putative dead deah box [Phaeomoniella chlamydospora]